VFTIDKILEYKKPIIIAGVILIVGIVAWDVFSSGDIGSGSSQVIDNISTTRDHQQSAIIGVGNAQDQLNDGRAEVDKVSAGLGEVAESIRGSQSGVTKSIDRAKTSTELIREGQSIILRVQQANQIRD
jgi:hypothetical protein